MGAMLGAGCLMIAYGPSAVLLFLYAARRSALLVLTIASAFVWLLSILAASLVWVAIPPLQTIHPITAVVGVATQALGRWLIVWLYTKVESKADALQLRSAKKWRASSDTNQRLRMFNDLSSALALGLGFGAMHTVMMYGALLGTAVTQEAAYYIDICPRINVFVLSAVTALLYNILHIALIIIALDAWRKDQKRMAILQPALLHLVFTLCSLFNMGSGGMCEASLPLQAVVLSVAVFIAVRVVRSPEYAATRQVRAWTRLVQLWDEHENEQLRAAAAATGHGGRSTSVASRAGGGIASDETAASAAMLRMRTGALGQSDR